MSDEQQVCENCSKPNAVIEKYCYACGHILPAGKQVLATHRLSDDQPLEPQFRGGTAYFDEQMMLHLHVHGANKLIEKRVSTECTLGRVHEDASSTIDLSPYQAVELGVSREHAKLSISGKVIKIQDLDSSNGTFLNGQQLLPFQPRVVRNGDELSLGRLVLRISFVHAPKKSD